MKYQILFSGVNKKNIINLLSAEFAHSTLSVKAKNVDHGSTLFASVHTWGN